MSSKRCQDSLSAAPSEDCHEQHLGGVGKADASARMFVAAVWQGEHRRPLARSAAAVAYRPAHRTSDRQRHARAQLSVREALVQTRARYISLIGALLRREGLRVASGNAVSFTRRVA
jgi:hypothetical protein